MKITYALGVFALLCVSTCLTAQNPFDAVAAEALLALDTGRFEEAVGLFENAARYNPSGTDKIRADWAWAFVRLGYEAVERRDWEAADSFLSRAVDLDSALLPVIGPQFAHVRVQTVRDVIDAARESHTGLNESTLRKRIEQALAVFPDYMPARCYLGWLYESEGRTGDARREYATVAVPSGNDMSLDAYRRAARAAISSWSVSFELPLDPVFAQFYEGEPGVWRTPHFAVHHPSERIAARIAAALEWYLAQPALEGLLPAGPDMGDVCTVYVYRTQKEFTEATKAPSWSGGASRMTWEADTITSAEIALIQRNPRLLDSTVPHELAHVRFAVALGRPENVPRWIWEGVAVCAESRSSQDAAVRVLRTGLDADDLIPVEELIRAPEVIGGRERVFYAESFAAIDALIRRYGRDPFVQLVSAPDTQTQDTLIKSTYGLTPVDLEDLIIEWLDAWQ